MKHPHRKIIFLSVLAVMIMFGFSFALSPLYSKLCKNIDVYAGTRIATKDPILNREITVQFLAINNQNLAWDFYPRQKSIEVHPNENVKVFFYAKNNTPKIMTVQAIPSFSPFLSAKHFHKTECFCFSQHTLKPGAALNMPLLFHVDEDLPKEISVITLAYTLFEVNSRVSSINIKHWERGP